MLHRFLDVIFEYFARLVALLVVVPAAVLAVGVGTDRTQVVTARLWADQPAILAGSPYSPDTSGQSAAQLQTTLLSELILTDSFVSTVMSDAHLGRPSGAAATAAAADLQKNLGVSPEGPHVVLITYATTDPGRGLAVATGVIKAFEDEQQSVQGGQVTVADQALTTELQTARQEMNDAIAAQQQYHASHDPTTLASDPTYLSLAALASAKTSSYASLVAEADKVAQYQTAIPIAQSTMLHTLDPPQVAPRQINWKGPATKNAIYALVGVFALELIFLYNVTRRDQRVRTTHDGVTSSGLRYLGTTPDP